MTEILESWGLFEPVVVLPLLAFVEANTMPLSLRKLVRTGTPYDKGVMG